MKLDIFEGENGLFGIEDNHGVAYEADFTKDMALAVIAAHENGADSFGHAMCMIELDALRDELETAVMHLESILGQHTEASETLTAADRWLRSRKS